MRRIISLVIAAIWLPLLQVRGQSLAEEFEYPQLQQDLVYTLPPPAYPEGVKVDAHEEDSLALVAFYNSSGGPTTWLNQAGWLRAPVSEWHGISLDSLGRVSVIDLVDNNLSGELSSDLGKLAHLEHLDLRSYWPHGATRMHNKIAGAIPEELGLLTNLKTLNLYWNRFSGTIPKELGKLSKLEILTLSRNDLSGKLPYELANLAQLQVLDLDSNRLTGHISSGLGQLTNLRLLDLADNGLTWQIPRELGKLENLEDLVLFDNQLSGEIPIELSGLAQLKRLSLRDNRLVGEIPSALGQLTNLAKLSLRGNDLTGIIPPQLGGLSKLEWLSLAGNNLTGTIPRELGQLTRLEVLYLGSNSLVGSVPPELGQLGELEWLDLAFNNLSGTIPGELGQLSSLLSLQLQYNKFTGPIPAELGQLSRLQTLWVSENSLSGSIPAELGQLVNLGGLYLEDNNLSGSIPPELGNLSGLRWFDVSNNDLSGPIPPELGKLGELRGLVLSGNGFSGSIPPELGRLDLIDSFVFHSNQLSGPVPDWTRLEFLQRAQLQANQFLFADLLPNADLSKLFDFNYAPQYSIDTQVSCIASSYVFTTPAKAEGNQYQWYRYGEAIQGAQSDTLLVTSNSDLDDYQVTITNSALPDLTLFSRKASTRDAACTTQQYANIADSTLLVDFFNRTQGRFLWHNHSGWLEEPVAQWYGITLDASGRVTHVNLPRNNLVGQLPLSQLDQLPHLRHLDVSGNEFSGTIPKGLGALTQLEYLDLSHNTLAGELPKELAGQAPLKMLDVGDNQLVGAIPTELSQIATLQKLSVFWNQLSGPIPDFTGLDQLDSLDVSWNEFLFMDLLPNAPLTRLDNFVYAPQDSIETLLSRTASGFALTTAANALGNRYQWYRDDLLISGPQSDTLHVSATSDPAQYHVAITNDRLPDLTLVSRKKGVHDGLTLTEAELPQDFLLHQSYPNPFAEVTTVAFELGTAEHVRIAVYDLLGKAVATIADGRFTAGVHRVEFTGDHLASGQYMYRMEAGAYRATRFMSVIR